MFILNRNEDHITPSLFALRTPHKIIYSACVAYIDPSPCVCKVLVKQTSLWPRKIPPPPIWNSNINYEEMTKRQTPTSLIIGKIFLRKMCLLLGFEPVSCFAGKSALILIVKLFMSKLLKHIWFNCGFSCQRGCRFDSYWRAHFL